jgi:hypothetical protein
LTDPVARRATCLHGLLLTPPQARAGLRRAPMSMPRRSRPMARAITPVAPTRPIDRGRQPATNTASGRRRLRYAGQGRTTRRLPLLHWECAVLPLVLHPLARRGRRHGFLTPTRRRTASLPRVGAEAARGGMRSAAGRCSTLFGSALTTSELLTLHSKMLFTFHSRYLFAIGLDAGILASLGWSLSAAFR